MSQIPPPPPPNYANYSRPSYGPSDPFDLSLLTEAWQIAKPHRKQWVIGLSVLLVPMVLLVPVFLSSLSEAPNAQLSLLTLPLYLIIGLVSLITWPALNVMALSQVDGQPVDFVTSFKSVKNWGSVIGAYLVMLLLVFVGSVACSLPGLVAAGLFHLASPIATFQRRGAMESVSESLRVSKSHWFQATLTTLVLSMISGLGFYACFIGIFWTFPLYCLGTAIIYRRIYPLQQQGFFQQPGL